MYRQASTTSLASARADDGQAGDRPQRGELLDRLVGRAVFADADRVVREDVDDRDLHQGRQADRHPAVVAEDQEAGAERPHLDQGHAVHDGPHGVLADAEVEVAAGVAVGLEIARPLERHVGLGRGGQIGGPADQPGDVLGDRVQHLARGGPRRHALGVGGEDRQVFVPAVGELAVLDPVELVGQVRMLRLVASTVANQASRSSLPRRPMPSLKVVVNAVGDVELGVLGPAVGTLGELDLLLAQGLAVGGARVLLGGCTPADVAVDDDQGRPVGRA